MRTSVTLAPLSCKMQSVGRRDTHARVDAQILRAQELRLYASGPKEREEESKSNTEDKESDGVSFFILDITHFTHFPRERGEAGKVEHIYVFCFCFLSII